MSSSAGKVRSASSIAFIGSESPTLGLNVVGRCVFRKLVGQLPREYVPTEWPDSEFHHGLKDLRDKLYAHTDRDSGRTVTMRITKEDDDIASIEYRLGWHAFPVQDIPELMAFFERQRERFLTDAAAIHVELEAADADD